MRAAVPIAFLATLAGVSQGLFLALYAAHLAARASKAFFVFGSAAAVALAALGLAASFFPGRPHKTCGLRACLFVALVAAYGGAHYVAHQSGVWIGALGVAACVALFSCTANAYAASRFAIAASFLMGTASGFTFAVPHAAMHAPHLLRAYALAAMALTALAMAVRVASLKLPPATALESLQGKAAEGMRRVRFGFIVLGFIAPIVLVHLGVRAGMFELLAAAFLVQYVGLAMERWFFLAQADFPAEPNQQNMS